MVEVAWICFVLFCLLLCEVARFVFFSCFDPQKMASNFSAQSDFQDGGGEFFIDYSSEKIYFRSKCREEWRKLTKSSRMDARDRYSAFHGVFGLEEWVKQVD